MGSPAQRVHRLAARDRSQANLCPGPALLFIKSLEALLSWITNEKKGGPTNKTNPNGSLDRARFLGQELVLVMPHAQR